MQARGSKGQTLELRYGEELASTGVSVRYQMRCSTTYQEQWILSGGVDELEGYDYKGFRYVEVIGDIEVIQPESIMAIVRHYPFPEEASTFRSEDQLLQGIWEMCRNTVKFSSQEHFVDCPTREKGQYLGDNTITAPAHALLSGDLRLYRKALIDFAHSTQICPGMMAVAPGHFMQEFADYSLQWPDQLWSYYRYTGDKDFLREMAPYAVGVAEYFRKYARADGLLRKGSDKPNLVDWPPNYRDGYDFPLPGHSAAEGCHNVINAFYYRCLSTVNLIQEELGEPQPYELTSVAKAFQRIFFDPESGLYRDAENSSHTSLHANILPLYAGLVPVKKHVQVTRFLKGKGMTCGVYMAYFYLQALIAAGEYEAAYQTIVSTERQVEKAVDKEKPDLVERTGYWANMLNEGATTCFEAWSKRLKWNTSLCHPWASAPILILVEDIFGIKPGEPGWTFIHFQPNIPSNMPDTTLTLTVATGKITVHVKDGRADLIPPAGIAVI